jgi:hypothetical protein
MKPREWIIALTLWAVSEAAAQPACPRGELPAYSHNDYRNARPLEEALSLSYRGVEIDLLLVDGELRVGHDRREAQRGPRFETLYLTPIRERLVRCGRLVDDGTPFLMTIDLKESDPIALDSLYAALARTGPWAPDLVQLVVVGWSPPAELRAPLVRQRQFTSLNEPVDWSAPDVGLLSVDYSKTIGRWWRRGATRRSWWSRIDSIAHIANRPRLRVHHVPLDTGVVRRLRRAGVELIGTTTLAPELFRTPE